MLKRKVMEKLQNISSGQKNAVAHNGHAEVIPFIIQGIF